MRVDENRYLLYTIVPTLSHLVIALPNIASRGSNLDLVLTYSRAQKVSLATIIPIFRG